MVTFCAHFCFHSQGVFCSDVIAPADLQTLGGHASLPFREALETVHHHAIEVARR
jgi:hypothetical protein